MLSLRGLQGVDHHAPVQQVQGARGLGRRNNAQVEVLSGLASGDQVIVSGYAPFGKAERLQLVN